MDTTTLLGYISTFIIASSLIPQVIKSWKTKSTKDISKTRNSIYVVWLSLFLFYAIKINETPIIVWVWLELLLSISILVAKFVYRKKNWLSRQL